MSIYDQMHGDLQMSAIKKQNEIDAARARLDEMAAPGSEYHQLVMKTKQWMAMTADDVDRLEELNAEFRHLSKIVNS